MPDAISKTLQSIWAAWALAGLCLVILLLVATGVVNLHGAQSPSDYADRSARLAAEDRSEALRMKLDAQFPGPLKDTTIQRWRDPVDGTVCYVYLAVIVPHSAGPPGYVQYGTADTGSISCIPSGSGR